ncbi:hypothetical protein EDC94DRAFT_286819 [Helicostylum pulchrum]|nr:hypothetical protein EDC94DRAFT_286819 [Helicostylum pulchrum]
MLKSTLLTACALFAGVSAKLGITIPDADSVWYTGETGVIEWNSTAAEFGVSCDIQLIDVLTEEVALNLTNTSIPCSINTYNTTIAMPEFTHQDFLVRIGVPHNSSTWSYTQDFKILNK